MKSIKEKYQGKGYSRDAMILAIEILKNDYRTPEIHIGHRKNNLKAGKLYESLGFTIVDQDENDYFRKLVLK